MGVVASGAREWPVLFEWIHGAPYRVTFSKEAGNYMKAAFLVMVAVQTQISRVQMYK